jgi:hypothetical protein
MSIANTDVCLSHFYVFVADHFGNPRGFRYCGSTFDVEAEDSGIEIKGFVEVFDDEASVVDSVDCWHGTGVFGTAVTIGGPEDPEMNIAVS